MTTTVAVGESSGTKDLAERVPVPGGRRLLEIFTVAGFAIGQPLFSVYGAAPEEFVFRRVDGVGVVAFALVILLGPTLVLWAVGSLLAFVRASVGIVAHDLIMAALWFVLAVQVLQRIPVLPVVAVVAGGVVSAALGIVLGIASRGYRLWISFASPAPLVFALVFLLVSPVSDQVRLSATYPPLPVTVGKPAPVVVVVFDEFPLASIVDDDGTIDEDLYPNLAALSRESDAFLNVTSNAWTTVLSVPSILTGRLPQGDSLPTAATHGDNLFTLLGKSYDLRVHELLSLCPTSLCPQPDGAGPLPRGLGDLTLSSFFTLGEIVDPRDDGGDPGGAAFADEINAMVSASRGDKTHDGSSSLLLPERFGEFLDDIDRPTGRRPTLTFLHVLLPHAPWTALPTGQTYVPRGTDSDLLGLDEDLWTGSQQDVELARQRHLLQVQYTDNLIGELERRMRAAGTWDRSTVVVTADHGEGFIPGMPRRGGTTENAAQIAWVPLFVKTPGQHIGAVSDRPGQLVDVVPTIADALDVRIPWKVDGRSLLADDARPVRRTFMANSSSKLVIDRDTEKTDVLAAAAGSFVPDRGDPLRVYRAGRWADLVDRPVSSLALDAGRGGAITVESRGAWDAVDLDAPVVPAYVRGRVTGLGSSVQAVVVALNGRISSVRAVPEGSRDLELGALLPPSQLRSGRNALRFYAMGDDGGLTRLEVR